MGICYRELAKFITPMNIEAPAIARRLFSRLCKGDNLLLSRNGAGEDAELFEQVERVEADGEPCKRYFDILGFRLQKGDNCYYFTVQDDPQTNLETKLDKMIRLVRLLDFFSTHVETFGEGQIFSASTLAARCNGDTKAERFLQEMGKGANNQERLENLLQSLVRQGYLSDYDMNRQEYRVLSAINYIFEFMDRIEIRDEATETEEPNAKT
jgi:hypothetical protein